MTARTLAARILAAGILTFGTATAADPARAPRSLQVQIDKWEQKIAASPSSFDYQAHNELRHLYGAFDAEKSIAHAGIILKNCPMDGYMLDILADFQIGKDDAKAVASLLDFASKYPNEPFVVAACLIKAGDLTESDAEAKQLYQKVADMKDAGLDAYVKIAKEVLAKLGGEPQPERQPDTIKPRTRRR